MPTKQNLGTSIAPIECATSHTATPGRRTRSPHWILVCLIVTLGFGVAKSSAGDPLAMAKRPVSAYQVDREPARSSVPPAAPLGIGGVDQDLLRSGTPTDLDIPMAVISEVVDIDAEMATRIAVARAAWQWGPNARLGTIVPVCDVDGDVFAWDVDFTIDGSVLSDYVNVSQDWQAFCSRQALELEDRLTRGGGTAPARATSSKRYGSVTVSATYDAPPIRGSRGGVSSFYASGWIARDVAAQALGTAQPTLTRVLFSGSWERLFEFTDGERSVLVQGHEPWTAYDRESYVRASRKARGARLREVEEAVESRGNSFAALCDSIRHAHARYADDWIASRFRDRSPVYITGYNQEFIPYRWFGGCSPTSGSMVLNYYDELGYYGRITYDYTWKEDPVQEVWRCHVSDASVYMRDTMETDDRGRTNPGNIYSGMLEYANGYCGYNFSGGIDVMGNLTNWHFNDGRAEIDSGAPFVWSTTFYPGADSAHSVAVVGYDTSPDPNEFMCYNTWSTGGVVEGAPHSGGALDISWLQAPHPGGSEIHDVKLWEPDGHQEYNGCTPVGTLFGGETADIRWTNWGEPAHHIGLHYTTDSGTTWMMIDPETADDGLYEWNVPCTISFGGRVRIVQYSSTDGMYSSDSSYGDFRIVQRVPPPPYDLLPPDYTDCLPTSGTLDWEDVEEANLYRIRIGPNCYEGEEYEIATSHYNYTDLDPSTTYFWVVECRNDCGLWGNWSSCRAFTTGPEPLPPPDLIEPPNDATCVPTEGDLDWSDVQGATAYRVQIGLTCGGYSPSLEVTESTLHYSDLEPGRTYYWRVKTKDSCDNHGEYSACRRFTCGDDLPLLPPIHLSPPNGATDQLVTGTLDWTDVPDAAAYRLQIGTTCGSGAVYLIDPAVSEFDYYDLETGETYFWQVQTKDACENWSSYSDCFSFTTREGANYLVLPDGTGDFPTIQATIDAASDGDIIELADGTFEGIGNRDLDYHGKAVTVRSQSGDPADCIISCGGSASENHRGFYFHSGEGYGSILAGVTIQYGYADQGGGVYCTAATPLIRNCVIQICTASGNGGGFFFIASYTPIMQGCLIYGNVASLNGGGVYCTTSSPSFQDCVFQANYATADGGGMIALGSTVTLLDCSVLSNTADDDGGGLCVRDASEASFTSCVIASNTATENGGAVYSYGNTDVSYSSCTIDGNSAPIGGGLSLRGTCTANLRHTILSFSASGASVYCDATSSATATCSDVYGNAGGDWVDCLVGLNGIEGNIWLDPLYCQPGNLDYTLHADSPCAEENNPECGRIGVHGISCGPSQPLTVLIRPDGTGDYPTIQAAIDDLMNGSVIELADGVFTGPGNRDMNILGKLITIRSQSGDPSICIIDCEGSAAEPHRAFSFLLGETAVTTLEGVTIRGGYVEDGGGAVVCRDLSSPTLTDCIFEANSSNAYGGAIFCDGSASPSLMRCVFRNNFAADYGGAIELLNSSSPSIVESSFIDNLSEAGGAIDAYQGSSPELILCTFDGNEAVWGGAIFCESTSLTPIGCTFHRNASPPQRTGPIPLTGPAIVAPDGRSMPTGGRDYGGAGIYVFVGASVDPRNTIFAFSTAGWGILCDGGGAILTCCDVYGNAGGDWVGCLAGQEEANGNLRADPLFCNPEQGELTLLFDSPCAEQANPECERIGAHPVGCGYHYLVRPDGSGDYPTIQAAIDGASDRDIVVLADGIFAGDGNRDVDFHGKAVTVRSLHHDPTTCIIDCGGTEMDQHRGFRFGSGENAASILEGVTIRNGYAYAGGGIACMGESSSPTIRDCVLIDNHATVGGAFHCENGSSVTVTGCTMYDNQADWGGAFVAWGASPIMTDCTVSHNGAVYEGGGIYAGGTASLTIRKTIVSFSANGEAVGSAASASVSLSCMNLFGNAGGDWVGAIADQQGLNDNMEADPLYCDSEARNFQLQASSPCLAENSPECGGIGSMGMGCASSDVQEATLIPSRLSLAPGAPNPFGQSIQIGYGVPEGKLDSRVILTIFDAYGRKVRTVVDETVQPGIYRFDWDGRDAAGRALPSGIYFLRLRQANEISTRRITLLR